MTATKHSDPLGDRAADGTAHKSMSGRAPNPRPWRVVAAATERDGFYWRIVAPDKFEAGQEWTVAWVFDDADANLIAEAVNALSRSGKESDGEPVSD